MAKIFENIPLLQHNQRELWDAPVLEGVSHQCSHQSSPWWPHQ